LHEWSYFNLGIDAATTLSKIDILSTTTSSIAATSLLPKPLDTAGFYLVVDSLVNNPNTYIKDSNSIIAKPLNILQLLNNNYFTVRFVI
jgi:hypothetical protein